MTVWGVAEAGPRGLWLIRKAFQAGPGGLLLGVAAGRGVGRSPWFTAAGVHHGVAARLAAGPAVPGRRLVAAGHRRVGLITLEIQVPWFLASRDPPPDVGRAAGTHLTTARLAGVFAALAPARPPGRAGAGRPGVGVAELRHHRRGSAARWASAPITFDARQWWAAGPATAQGLTRAPRRGPRCWPAANKIPVGGTIRAIGHPWHPVFTLEPGACAPAHGDRGLDPAAGRRT